MGFVAFSAPYPNHLGLPAADVYLLGMYLGDGCLSPHPRGVYKLRISLGARYPGIAEECERAMRSVMPSSRVGRVGYRTWHELFAYSKCWPCLFPQHVDAETFLPLSARYSRRERDGSTTTVYERFLTHPGAKCAPFAGKMTGKRDVGFPNPCAR